jgi:regulator of sirC expression with transglutaminase-like and TPR domain
MTDAAIKAMIHLLDDSDQEVVSMVEQQIRTLSPSIIPVLETEWENESLNPFLQEKIENLIHDFQWKSVQTRLQFWKEAGGLDLLEGMWIISTYRYPDYSFDELKLEMDQLYYEVWPQMREDLHPMDQVKVLNSVLFDQLKFGPNSKNFHAVNNSFINQVLSTKKGNPISLCIIYLWIAQKMGMPIYGVNLPNLFVLTYQQKGVQFYINVFNKGLIFSKTDIDNYIAQLNLTSNEMYYSPCTNIEIIRRVLRNLVMAYEKAGESAYQQELTTLIQLLD